MDSDNIHLENLGIVIFAFIIRKKQMVSLTKFAYNELTHLSVYSSFVLLMYQLWGLQEKSRCSPFP